MFTNFPKSAPRVLNENQTQHTSADASLVPTLENPLSLALYNGPSIATLTLIDPMS